ncbi:MAG: DUF1254 domain-containing protein [Alphaproteobacteria bacterium]|nr:DUF1254 domain-containing protein [Alphaproteobacteria bacterium]MBU2085651.1 DUF1254 domain-containing protein [Alphaproteobacteria bacterium]MBU2141664.1 DUF1254 domain-containing protein [Alphaproteobacteria bacterium]MBU2197627.1 DUF1254 domain-containing protein [Alphaproteobacteria bacterium]
MRGFLVGLGAFVVTFALAHFVVLNAVPGKIMSKVRERMMANGLPMQQWQMTPRVSPENQRVVRPAPDLAYAICVIDLTDGPVELDVPSWNAYGSLSVFSARTDNVYAGSLDARAAGTPAMRRVVVATSKQDVSASGDAEIVRVEQPEALALVRRLAPTQEAYDAAAALMPESLCKPL